MSGRLDRVLLALSLVSLLLGGLVGLTSLSRAFADARVLDADRAWRDEDQALARPVEMRLAARGTADWALAQRQADLRAGRSPRGAVDSSLGTVQRSYGRVHLACTATFVDLPDGALRVDVSVQEVSDDYTSTPPPAPVKLSVLARVTADAVEELSAR